MERIFMIGYGLFSAEKFFKNENVNLLKLSAKSSLLVHLHKYNLNKAICKMYCLKNNITKENYIEIVENIKKEITYTVWGDKARLREKTKKDRNDYINSVYLDYTTLSGQEFILKYKENIEKIKHILYSKFKIKLIREIEKNKVEIKDDYVVLYTPNSSIEFLIDKEDYEKIKHLRWADHKGYLRSGKLLYHRYILNVTDKNILIDHINMKRNDNRKENLRIVDKSKNSINVKPKNRLGIKGIRFVLGKWEAYIKLNQKIVYRQRFDDLKEAIKCKIDAEVLNFKEYRYAWENDINWNLIDEEIQYINKLKFILKSISIKYSMQISRLYILINKIKVREIYTKKKDLDEKELDIINLFVKAYKNKWG